jgi:hypothetical protein
VHVSLANALCELDGADLMTMQSVRQLAQQWVQRISRDSCDYQLLPGHTQRKRWAFGQ